MKNLKVLPICALTLSTLMIPASASTDVKIETKATEINVTVPSSIEFIFNEDGSNTLPTNFNITNNSQIARVSLVKAELDAANSGWRLLPSTSDTRLLAVDSKDIQFYMGPVNKEKIVSPGTSANKTGTATWANGEITIEATKTQNIAFDINRGAFNTPKSSVKAFDMTLTFEFNQ